MITAKKNKIATIIGCSIAKQLLSTHFNSILIKKLPSQELESNYREPVLLLANHSCRWDTPIIYYLVQSVLNMDCYIMMGSDAIRKYPIARSLGCFEVDASNPITSAQSIVYAASLARDQTRCIVVFPQGRYFRNHKRPLQFTLGAAQLARKIKNLRILPVALYYDYFTSELPEVFISIGDPISPTKKKISAQELTNVIQRAITTELDELESIVADNNLEHFTGVLPGKNSVHFWLLKKLDPKWEKRAIQEISREKNL